jgi:hypothetical protein
MDLLEKSEVKTEQRAVVRKEDLKEEDEEESEYEEVSVEESEEASDKPTAVTEGKIIPPAPQISSEPQTDL